MTSKVKNNQLKIRFKPCFFPLEDLLLRGLPFVVLFCFFGLRGLLFFVLLSFEVPDLLLPDVDDLAFCEGII